MKYLLPLLLLSFLFSFKPKEKPTTRPNIVYIMADDLGYNGVSFNGQTKYTTPNIDRIAHEGMIFTSHYAGSTVCGPSRAALLTGNHTGHNAIRENRSWRSTEEYVPFPNNDVNIALRLKKAGYQTAVIGKWGQSDWGPEYQANRQGFDYFFGYRGQGEAPGIEVPQDIDGISYLPTLLGKDKQQKKHEYLYWEFNESDGPRQAIRQGDWKVVKLWNKPPELYDLSKDIGERNNLATKHPDLVKKYSQLLKAARTDDPNYLLVPTKYGRKK